MKNILAIAFVVALAACNTSTEGANGNVLFTPDNCGRIGCNFDDSIGVGGTIEMYITGRDGVSTAGATIESDDPAVLEIATIPDVGGRPTWELFGASAGVGRLTVYDANDAVLDFIEIGVQELSALGAENILGDAVGPADDPSYDEVWTVNADQAVSFQITPLIGEGVPTMGKYTYTATIDQGIEDGLLDEDLSEGYLYFQVPAGEYAASFEDDYGHAIDLLIVAQ
jgi:hypothetical protein